MSKPEGSAEIVRRYVEQVWNQGDLDLIDDLLSPAHIRRDAMNEVAVVGSEAVRGQIEALRRAFPDFHFEVQVIPGHDGEYVTRRWTMTGTHRGEWMGVVPTGRSVKSTGLAISRIENGKIAEDWVQRDDLGLLRQIGGI